MFHFVFLASFEGIVGLLVLRDSVVVLGSWLGLYIISRQPCPRARPARRTTLRARWEIFKQLSLTVCYGCQCLVRLVYVTEAHGPARRRHHGMVRFKSIMIMLKLWHAGPGWPQPSSGKGRLPMSY